MMSALFAFNMNTGKWSLVSFPDLGVLTERILRILATSLGMIGKSLFQIGQIPY